MSAFFKTEVNAHNLYRVSKSHRHYLWCLAAPAQRQRDSVVAVREGGLQ